MSEPKLAELSAVFEQDADSNSTEPQCLHVSIENAGAGPYIVLKTDRWAVDPEDLDKMVLRIRALFAQVEA